MKFDSGEHKARAAKPETPQNCEARHCPQMWSVAVGGSRLCSYHAWAEPKEWPQITEDLRLGGPWRLDKTRDTYVTGDGPRMSRADIMQQLATVRAGSREWAHRLKARERAGEKLSVFQRQAWRDAIGDDDD